VISPVLVTLYGDEDPRDVIAAWDHLSPAARRQALGFWPLLIKAAKVGLRVGAKVTKKIAAKVRSKRKAKKTAASARAAAVSSAEFDRGAVASAPGVAPAVVRGRGAAVDPKMLLIAAAVIGAIVLMRK